MNSLILALPLIFFTSAATATPTTFVQKFCSTEAQAFKDKTLDFLQTTQSVPAMDNMVAHIETECRQRMANTVPPKEGVIEAQVTCFATYRGLYYAYVLWNNKAEAETLSKLRSQHAIKSCGQARSSAFIRDLYKNGPDYVLDRTY